MSDPRPPSALVPAPSRWQLPPGPWSTLLDGLCARFPQVSRAQWQDRCDRGRVQDPQGQPLPAALPYRVGLDVRYFREVADEALIAGVERIVHADAHLVVADKPHGLPVTPSGRYLRETLLARLVARLGNPALVPLHRLDRATAGLVLFSADPGSRAAYQALFRERRIAKTYQALAPALPGQAFPLLRASRLVRGEPFFRMAEADGEANSLTRIAVLDAPDGPLWRYALAPVTGRKHQLRVHMAALGAPILGDALYPQLCAEEEGAATDVLQLLACGLAFDDPLSGQARSFASAQTLAWPPA
ncbi:pseudouridine synthase [Xanthomonas cerealis pv. cerealis]|uniref:Pseudouridine synthase n=1 Tax=Xanthomonas cerealis pv. cerealis TaxID=152263 RepID=A0A514EC86_9XANT|nr:pseudouridine synthase [Xanthomonas translucens]QDI03654.1 pseudouridine synthase [Xanthomonas translucens pv. cerealis]